MAMTAAEKQRRYRERKRIYGHGGDMVSLPLPTLVRFFENEYGEKFREDFIKFLYRKYICDCDDEDEVVTVTEEAGGEGSFQ